MRKKTLDELIEKANIIHNSKYTCQSLHPKGWSLSKGD